MKKVLVMLVVFSLLALSLAGCAGTSSKGGAVKMGLGINTSIAKSRDYSVKDGKETLAQAQVDTVIVAASFDKDGKVVTVHIDSAQTRVAYDKDMKVTADKTAKPQTKKERKDDYGMKKVSNIEKEWYEQIEALENWMVGKTIEEIKNMKVKKVDDAHPSVPDIDELTSSVTITIQDYVAALEKAYNNAIEVKGVTKLGLGHTGSIAKSRDYSVKDGKETLAQAQVDTIISATGFDKDGKVVAALIDSAQTRIAYDKDGKVTSDKAAKPQTKKERKDDYGMKKVSNIEKEWYEQIEALENWMAGKTIAEIKGMKVKKVDDAHPSVPDIEELSTLVTITIQDYIFAVEEASQTAK
jgi:hypothetical protein